MTKRTRKSFSELVRDVGSVARVRDLSKRRIAARRRRELAPRTPAKAIAQLKGAGRRYAAQAQKLLEKHVLPALGNDAALRDGIAVFGRELDALASRVLPSARGVATKASKAAHEEYARIMGVTLPKSGVGTGAEAFAQNIVYRYQVIASAQTEKLLEMVAAGEVQTAEDLTYYLWVVRNRTQTVAETEVERLFNAVFRMWTSRGGDEWSVWITRRDNRVRHSHREREGKVFRTELGLGGILPGEEIGCRCTSLPASADLT